MILIVDFFAVLMFIVGAFCSVGAAAVLVAIGEFFAAHLTATIIGIVIISIIVGAVKTLLVCAEDDTLWGVSFIASLMSVGSVILFAFMYIIPLWVYYGGFHSLVETIASIIIFYIISSGISMAVSTGVTEIDLPKGPSVTIANFLSKVVCIIALYFIGVDGIRCYLFDYLGIMAPFV